MNFISWIGLLSVLFMLSSCKDEQSSLENYWVTLATVKETSNSGTIKVQFDNGTNALATESISEVSAEAGARILVNYSLLADSIDESHPRKIRINSINTVEIKGIGLLSTVTEDSIGDDPVNIEDIGVGANYLNISLSYYGNQQNHLFSVVENTTFNDGLLHLELRHNAKGDRGNTKQNKVISFVLSKLVSDLSENEIQMVIETKNYTGNVIQYTIKYKYR
jgi:hypothetical protein